MTAHEPQPYNSKASEHLEGLHLLLRIRLRRVGKKKQPSYRIVVADVRSPRDGAFVEQVGHYNPLTDPPTVVLDHDKVQRWLGVGAKPTDTVGRILKAQGVVEKAEA